MADGNGNEPMIKLEPNGTAPVISYNVPEPASYAGRNFIDLQIPASYFVRPTTAASVADIGSGESRSNGSMNEASMPLSPSDGALEALMSGDQISGVDLALEFGAVVPGAEELSPKLRNLDPDEIRVMASAGKRLNVYRSLYGTLTYNYG
jgi:hypothetical protein